MMENVVLEMRGICKYFPGVRALEQVDFTLREGEIHALMGENGAGKSTLIKVLTGVYPKDAGYVTLSGAPVHIKSPQDAQKDLSQTGVRSTLIQTDFFRNLEFPQGQKTSSETARSQSSRW